MSNLTPQDVDVRLTATRNELVEEDLRLWEGLEDEKISRIAGDEANKQLINLVVDANQDTENRLSTEVLHRSEGDLSNVSSLTAFAQAMSQYRIKTDLELGNEKIARQQLGVDLTTRINSFVASWDHDKFLIYQSIQTVQLDVNNKYVSMDLRIKKYEDMLQDITMDSIQITMDSGEINMGAWTILSQAREWDLEILGKFKDYKHDTDQGIDEALKDIQDKLPVVEDIINKAIEQLSNAPIIQALDERIGNSEITIDGVTQTVMQHQIDNQNEMIKLAKSLSDQVVAESESLNEQLTLETTTRIDELRKESTSRRQEYMLLDDGLNVEIVERTEGDNKAYELIENLKASSEGSLADVYRKIAVNTDGITASATSIEQLDTRVVVAQDAAGKALENAATALTQANTVVDQNKALAERVTTTEASLEDKVSSTTFNQTKSEVERIDGVTRATGQDVSALQSTVTTMNGVVTGNTNAINSLTINQTATGDTINQIGQRTTVLESSVGVLKADLTTNVTAVNDLKTQVNQNGTEINAISQQSTVLKAKIDNIKSGGDNLLKKSNVETRWNPAAPQYPHCIYNLSENWEAGAKYTITFCVTHASTGDTAIGVYAGGGVDIISRVSNAGDRATYTVTFTKQAVNSEYPWVHFYLLNYANDLNATATIHWAVLSKGESVGVTNWKPSNQDTVDGLANTASAEALNTLKADVSYIDGKVSANANDLTVLKGTVDNNQSYIINNYYTKADANDATANHITQFESTLSVGGRNLVRNTALPVTGDDWLFQEKLTRKIQGEVTITWEVEDLSGAPLSGGIGFNMGNGGLGGYEYFDYPVYTTGKHKITKVVDSKSFTHFGFYSNSDCKITNVKVEDGSVPSTWTPAPEDLEIGGRNLLQNSDFRKGLGYWDSYGANMAVAETNINNKHTKYAYISNVTTGIGGLYMQQVNVPYIAKAGDTMTVSFLGRGNGKLLVGFDDSAAEVTVDTTWRRYSVTLRRKKNDNVIFYCNGATYVDIALPKLELGDKATDWTPAPEDNIQEIEAQATAVNSLTTQVSNIDGRVSSTASQVLTLTSTVNGIPQGSGNLLLNSDFSSDTTANSRNPKYWSFAHHVATPDNKVLTDSDMLDWKINAEPSRTLQLHAQGAYDPSLSYYIEASQYTAITGGKPYQISAYTGAHRTYVYIFAYFYDANGDLITNTPVGAAHSTNANEKLGGKNLDGYKRIYQTMTAPVNAVSLRFVIRMLAHSDSYAFITRCMVTELTKESNALVSWADSAGAAYVSIQQTNQAVDGVKAVSTVSVDNNGFMSGYGLISQLVNGVVTSAFGINADYFYVGTSNSNKKKPFMVLTSPQDIGGVTYPAGTWMDVALIANATIGTAHIADASITNAKIKDLDASKITSGFIDAGRIRIGAGTQYETGYDPTKISIGGVNLFGSNNNIDGYNVSVISRTHTLTGNTLNCGTANVAARTLRINGVLPENNVWYTFSGYAKGNQGVAASFRADIGDAGSTTFTAPADGSWLFFSVTAFKGVITNTHNFCDIEPLDWLNYEFKDIKIEKGNKATAWSASNYDLNRGVAAATDTANVANQKVTNWARAENVTYIDGRNIYTGSIYADQISSGAVTADKLYSNTVSGMFANFGRFESKVAGVGTTVISGPTIEVYDTQRLRVFIGVKP